MKTCALRICGLALAAAVSLAAAPGDGLRPPAPRPVPITSAALPARISRDVSAVLARHAAEAQSETLWAAVRREAGEVLFQLWRNGELRGTKPEEAYFVRCDRTTMTAADIEGGVLKVTVGYAAVKPAEFEVLALVQVVRKR